MPEFAVPVLSRPAFPPAPPTSRVPPPELKNPWLLVPELNRPVLPVPDLNPPNPNWLSPVKPIPMSWLPVLAMPKLP